MSTDTSNDCLPDWVAEHQSPWLESQVVDSSTNSDDQDADQLAGVAEHRSHEQRPEGPSQQAAVADPSGKKAAVTAALMAAPSLPGQIPVMLPEKLSASRCLIEVEEDATTDLAGDAGAVGRFGIVRHGQAQLDLKGQVYSMTVIPCASTLCVLNIRSADAKVETMLSDFVQLRAEPGQSGPQDHEALHLFGDDDENYQEQNALGGTTAQVDSGLKKKASQQTISRKSKASAAGNNGIEKKRVHKKQTHGK